MAKKNETNFTIIRSPLSYIGIILIIIFFILSSKGIYEPIQIGIYIFMIIAALYTLYNAYVNDKKEGTTNFKEKIIVAIILILLFVLSYFIMPIFFK